MKHPLVTIIIVNWNGKAVLRRCLASLAKQTYRRTEIIVFDNHSTDGSAGVVRKSFPMVNVIAHTENAGFAAGNNMAVKHARGEYVLLLNSDTIVTDDFLQPLVSVLETDPDAAVVQPLLLYKGNPLYSDGSINSAGTFFTPTGFLYYPFYAKPAKRLKLKQMNMFSANGACMLVRKSVIDEIGLFDDDFFAYYEETDFCHRVLLTGGSIVFEPRSIVYHQGSATSGSLPGSFVLFHSYKNRINSFLKNLGVTRLIMTFSIHALAIISLAMYYALRGRITAAWAIMRAVLWNIVKLPITIRKRYHVQNTIRNVQDAELFGLLMKYPNVMYYYYLVTGLERFEEHEENR